MTESHGRAEERSARLVALLDLVERPAAAVDIEGGLLGANQRLHDLAKGMNVAELASVEALVDAQSRSSCRRALAALAGSREARDSFELEFVDGAARRVIVERIGEAGRHAVFFVAIDAPTDARSAMRAQASLSHDLAGPLTAILGTAELLLIRGQDLPRDVRDSLGQILENCGRITEILSRDRHTEIDPADGSGA